MARYRDTTGARVGRDKPSTSPTPTPTPVPTIKSGTLSSTIQDKLLANSPEYADVVQQVDMTVDDYIDNLSADKKKRLAQFLKNKKVSGITTVKDIYGVLTAGGKFDFVDTDFRSFNTFLNAINNQIVSRAPSGGDGVSRSVTKYGTPQIDAWVDDWLIKNVGQSIKSITPEQIKMLRKVVRDYTGGESVTRSTVNKKGQRVTEYTPATSQAGIEKAIEKSAKTMFAPEIERRQALEFSDALSKALGIGSI